MAADIFFYAGGEGVNGGGVVAVEFVIAGGTGVVAVFLGVVAVFVGIFEFVDEDFELGVLVFEFSGVVGLGSAVDEVVEEVGGEFIEVFG